MSLNCFYVLVMFDCRSAAVLQQICTWEHCPLHTEMKALKVNWRLNAVWTAVPRLKHLTVLYSSLLPAGLCRVSSFATRMFLFASISQRLLVTRLLLPVEFVEGAWSFPSFSRGNIKTTTFKLISSWVKSKCFLFMSVFFFPQLNSSAVVFWSAPRPWPVLLWKLLLCCRLAWRQMWIPVWHQPVGEQAEVHVSRWQNLQQQRSVCSGQDTDPAQDPVWALISFSKFH